MEPEFDGLDEVAREMRQSDAAGELRDEAAMAELETYQGRRRKRSLADVARIVAHRGDLVMTRLGQRTLEGEVVHVGSDYVTLETAHSIVDLRLGETLISVFPRSDGGHDLSRGSVTLKARLSEYEQTGEPVSLMVAGDEIACRILVVAVDHVLVDHQSTDVYVPLPAITAVLRPRTAR